MMPAHKNKSIVFSLGMLPGILLLGAAAMAHGGEAQLKHASTPDFGPNVVVFDPSMPAAGMQAQIDKIYAVQQHNEFGPERNALLFLPGEYHLNIPVGFYTEVMGLGHLPD